MRKVILIILASLSLISFSYLQVDKKDFVSSQTIEVLNLLKRIIPDHSDKFNVLINPDLANDGKDVVSIKSYVVKNQVIWVAVVTERYQANLQSMGSLVQAQTGN